MYNIVFYQRAGRHNNNIMTLDVIITIIIITTMYCTSSPRVLGNFYTFLFYLFYIIVLPIKR